MEQQEPKRPDILVYSVMADALVAVDGKRVEATVDAALAYSRCGGYWPTPCPKGLYPTIYYLLKAGF